MLRNCARYTLQLISREKYLSFKKSLIYESTLVSIKIAPHINYLNLLSSFKRTNDRLWFPKTAEINTTTSWGSRKTTKGMYMINIIIKILYKILIIKKINYLIVSIWLICIEYYNHLYLLFFYKIFKI